MKCLQTLLGLFLLLSLDAMAQNWTVGGNNLASNGRIGANTDVDVIFETNNAVRGRVTSSGLWGFGVTAPNARVHVGAGANSDALKVDVDGQTKLLVAGNGGTSIGSAAAAPLNGLFVTGGIGFGAAPGSYKLKVVHGLFGLDIERGTDDWELVTAVAGFYLVANGATVGFFNETTGAYSSISDERMKTGIQAMPPVLDRIRLLQPSTYQMHRDGLMTDASPRYGFIAQDVEAVFPHLVEHHVDPERDLDAYTVDYAGFGVLAIKAIQELEARVAELEKELAQLR